MNWLKKQLGKELWSPYAAGILLGIVGILTVVLTDKILHAPKLLGASGGFENIAGFIGKAISPSNTYFNYVMTPGITFAVILTANQAPFSASCSFAYNPAVVGQLDPVTMYQSGGVTPVTYVANGANLGTGTVLNITPVSPGSATVQFIATDATGRTASNSCSVFS